jgi:hypothetical protein
VSSTDWREEVSGGGAVHVVSTTTRVTARGFTSSQMDSYNQQNLFPIQTTSRRNDHSYVHSPSITQEIVVFIGGKCKMATTCSRFLRVYETLTPIPRVTRAVTQSVSSLAER